MIATYIMAGCALVTTLGNAVASVQHWRHDKRRFAEVHERISNGQGPQ